MSKDLAENRSAPPDPTQWIGRTEMAEDDLTLAPVRGLCATLDAAGRCAAGDALPPVWQWLYFLPQAPQSQLGPDGHARRGDFLPPIALPRRMFAGGRMRFHAPLRLGAPARREGRVAAVRETTGRTGRLAFVTVAYRYRQDDRLCLEEEQDIVYREPGPPVAPPARTADRPAAEAPWSRTVTADPVLLFRFSALTFNGHRIHYDRPYATDEEGYPGLVVHGPLIALLLAELARAHDPRPLAGFAFRAQAPLFDRAPFRLEGRPGAAAAELQAVRPDGAVAMVATASFA